MRAHATRLAAVVIGYLAIIVAVITLAPFRFVTTPVHRLSGFVSTRDAVLNVVLFLPFGFVFQLARARRRQAALLQAFLIGAALSTVIETAQFFAPDRYPSGLDVLTNALGAALGAAIATRALRLAAPGRAIRILALDLPLTGLTYLLLPVLWLTGLSAPLGGVALLLFPIASVAWIYASVHVAFAEPQLPSGSRPLSLWSGAALFLAVGIPPALLYERALLFWGPLVMASTIALRLVIPNHLLFPRRPDGSRSRRFEGPTLRLATLPIVGFLTALALWPVRDLRETWAWTWTLVAGHGVPADIELYRLLAQLATVTALGYAIAAEHGRRAEALAALGARALGVIALIILPLEWARGWGHDSIASAALVVLSAAAGVLGAWIYQLQLRQIQVQLRETRDG